MKKFMTFILKTKSSVFGTVMIFSNQVMLIVITIEIYCIQLHEKGSPLKRVNIFELNDTCTLI